MDVAIGIGFLWLYLAGHEIADHDHRGWFLFCTAAGLAWLVPVVWHWLGGTPAS